MNSLQYISAGAKLLRFVVLYVWAEVEGWFNAQYWFEACPIGVHCTLDGHTNALGCHFKNEKFVDFFCFEK